MDCAKLVSLEELIWAIDIGLDIEFFIISQPMERPLLRFVQTETATTTRTGQRWSQSIKSMTCP